MSEAVEVRGAASAEEVAAVLAVVTRRGEPAPAPGGLLAEWRSARRRAVKVTAQRSSSGG